MVNKALAKLDNGGYEVHYDQPPAKLSTSDVKLDQKDTDRLDNNRVKIFYNYSSMAHIFRFQEAVQKMQNRKEVDVR